MNPELGFEEHATAQLVENTVWKFFWSDDDGKQSLLSQTNEEVK